MGGGGSGPGSSGGGKGGGGDDGSANDNSRTFNGEKAQSKIWRSLQHYRGNIKTNGLKGKKARYYQWDFTHKDIEMYDVEGFHLGSLNPKTGELYKGPKVGRRIYL